MQHRRTRAVVGWAVIGIVVVFLVAELVVRVLPPLPDNRTWPDVETQFKVEHAAAVHERGEREPLVFAGSSVSDAAFDPAVVQAAAGIDGPSFNYGLEGSLAATTKRFLDAAVLDQVQPDVVVLGVFPGDIGAAPTRAAALGDELAHSQGYRLATGEPTLADRIDQAASDRSAVVAHREVLRDPYRLAQWLRESSTPEFLDAQTGALLKHRDVRFDPDALIRPGEPGGDDARAPVRPEVEAIEDLADELAGRGTRLVLVELPVYDAEWDETSSPGARRRTHDAMVQIGASTCAERVDLRHLAQAEAYWSDTAHVNGKGTELLSRAVGAWLAEHPDAPAGC